MKDLLPTLIQSIIDNITVNRQASEAGIATLVKLGGRDCVRVIIMEKAIELLTRQELLATTDEDVEIAAVAPDQLWNPSSTQMLVFC